jgi:hypothetical protein
VASKIADVLNSSKSPFVAADAVFASRRPTSSLSVLDQAIEAARTFRPMTD